MTGSQYELASNDTLQHELKMSLMMDETFLYLKWILLDLLTFYKSVNLQKSLWVYYI